MKQKDILLIGVVVFISAIFSYFISNAIFASPANRQQKVEVIQPISSTFQSPDVKFFNNTAIDPTKTITIGESANADPFNASQ